MHLNPSVGEVMKFGYALSGGHMLICTVRLCRGERHAKRKRIENRGSEGSGCQVLHLILTQRFRSQLVVVRNTANNRSWSTETIQTKTNIKIRCHISQQRIQC